MRSTWFFLLIATLLPGFQSTQAAAPFLTQQVLFKKGDHGYHTFRIPALVATPQGSVLAFCEARKNNRHDDGDIDLVLRRSEDGGQTWGPMQIIDDQGDHTAGNPCPVIDQRTGTIFLPYSIDNQRVHIKQSHDDGRSWSDPVDITKGALMENWHWVGPGPGHGIQLQNGRLVVPCWAGVEKEIPYGGPQISYIFYSDDGGESWQLGGTGNHDVSDECEVVELAPNTMYMTARGCHDRPERVYHFSTDGGVSWTDSKFDPRLPAPPCQGSILRVSQEGKRDQDPIVAAWPSNPKGRTQMTVLVSYDACQSWPVAKVIHEGGAAYSDLALNQQQEIRLHYEKDHYANITLARFNMAWLTSDD